MPITINGTTGISGVDGSAGTPALQEALTKIETLETRLTALEVNS